MDFNINVKNNNIVINLLEGARLNSRERYERLDKAKSEGKMVAYYSMKHAENEAIYASLDYTWHKNHYASLKSYAGGDAVSRAELAVDKAKTTAAKARYDHAIAVHTEAEKEWMI
tara:strand:+ start:645 stop:989 length:345 start_codon:yes stop_codon:yes gene_type:complete